MPPTIPARLVANCRKAPERMDWLARLPDAVAAACEVWQLEVGEPFDGDEVSAAWVAPAMHAGTPAVLKLGMPHFESDHEVDGLRFWDGDPTVRLLEADAGTGAMLLERCEPGTHLRDLPEEQQDEVIAALLRRMWRVPPEPHPFRPLREMTAVWAAETRAETERRSDPGLVEEGLRLFEELPRTSAGNVLLATDLHAGNVLRAQREPWLAIDPKPFVGDPAYDATQHLLNTERLDERPRETVDRVADLLGLDRRRVRLWTFARLTAEPGRRRHPQLEVARALAP
jgi:streptomycin 6-kinase